MMPVYTLYRLRDEINAITKYFFYIYDAMNFMHALGVRILISNSCTRRALTARMWDGRIFLKSSALLPLIKSYRISLLLARSVSLDSNLIDDRKLISLCILSVYHLVLTYYAEHHNIINN
jgi:hypothetical protein